MHTTLNCSGCLLKMQKLKLNDIENAPNENIYFRTSLWGRIQNFSWNSYFPTRNLVLFKLYLLASMFAADMYLLLLFSAVEKHICKLKFHSGMWVKILLSRDKSYKYELLLWPHLTFSELVPWLPRAWNLWLSASVLDECQEKQKVFKWLYGKIEISF